jgi:hypothetical protein
MDPLDPKSEPVVRIEFVFTFLALAFGVVIILHAVGW